MTQITFQGRPVKISGMLPAVGTKAPDFNLTNVELSDVSLATYQGKRKILVIVPSLDTPVCGASARILNEKAATLDNTAVLIISADLPFAQCRFCDSEGLARVTALSSFRSNFAQDYGVMLMDTLLAGLTARALIIIDEHDTVIYTQLVAELANEPDYQSALAAL